MPIELRSFWLLVMCLAGSAHGYVDMFIDATETSSLVGMSNSLFYVFNGELRQSSISHHLNIPVDKKRLKLNWETEVTIKSKFPSSFV